MVIKNNLQKKKNVARSWNLKKNIGKIDGFNLQRNFNYSFAKCF